MEKHERLKYVRQRLGMTQKQMGDLLGITESAYNMIEHGKRSVKPIYIEMLNAKKGVSIKYMEIGEGSVFEMENVERIKYYYQLSKDNQLIVDKLIQSLLMTQKEE